MLLLNGISLVSSGFPFYFNTSYVVIKQLLYVVWISVTRNFNTSYVVIKRRQWDYCKWCNWISIHLMLLLNLLPLREMKKNFHISIHLMLLLNCRRQKIKRLYHLISIHLMLLLNNIHSQERRLFVGFQYILCCY